MLQRIIRIIFSPQAEWERIARERTGVLRALSYAMVLAAIPALVAYGTPSWQGALYEGSAARSIDPQRAAGLTFAGAWLGVLLIAAVFWGLARIFARTPRWSQAIDVAAYGTTPVLLAAAFLAFPSFAMVPLVAMMHALYLYYTGAHEVFGIKHDECAEFIALALLAATIGLFMLGVAAGHFGWI